MTQGSHHLHARKIAGQLTMIRIPGTELTADVAQFLQENHIRAVCLFRQNMVDGIQLSKLTADLQTVMGKHALIAIDQEGGAVVRTTWLPSPPAALALGASNDSALARAVGAAVARGLRSLGFNWNFAPVLDLNNNVHNPVIAERSFGADPQRATTLALAWMEGSLSEGVACCVKHVPGHGDTHVDSHCALPTVDKPRPALEALEFSPFQQTAQIAPAMMTAHIVYPTLDANFPATLSRAILTDLIRGQWDFQGIVITDGMDMHAIADHYGVGTAAVLALEAGADMVMELGTRESQQTTLDALCEAIAMGKFSADELNARLARLDQLAQRYPCMSQPYTTESEDTALMATAWRRGLTPFGNPSPPAMGSKIRLVIRASVVSDGVSESGLPAQQLIDRLSQWYDVETTFFHDSEQFDWATLPGDERFILLASTTRKRYGKNTHSWRPDLHLALWNPFQALDIDAPALLTYGFAPPALDALEAWLLGTIKAEGINPCLIDGTKT